MHIIIMPKGKGQYSSHLADGGLLIESTTTPLFASARVLQELGIPNDTKITMSHIGSNIISMRSTVSKAAKLTIEETGRDGIQVREFRPMAEPHVEQAQELRLGHPATVSSTARLG